VAATGLTATRTRVARVVPPIAMVFAAVADMRATPSDDAELVDQLHHKERVRVLGRSGEWAYVQADEDHYFGWVSSSAVTELPGALHGRVVASLLAPVYDEPDPASEIVGHLPVGTIVPTTQSPCVDGPWLGFHGSISEEQDRKAVGPRVYSGYISLDDVVDPADLPWRPPTPDDLIATAQAFIGVPYLWGGTTALGMDCSGFVQQVYRLNGVRLDRDADQQAVEGRPVDVPARGDLIFFGQGSVTHVGIAVDERSFLNAPEAGQKVQLDELGGGRNVLAIRRYLA
jgi:cell wall-associated NlpC family hydrolase